MRPHSLLAYDATGAVVATLDYMAARDDNGDVGGLIDFAQHEANGGEHTEIWTVATAVGSKVWPEWLGMQAHDFRVELQGPPGRKRIVALVHKTSGHRRERAAIEAAIASVAPDETGARDLRHIVGGPARPLALDETGRTIPHEQSTRGTPGHLPRHGQPAN